jgi:hypothetical protein
LRGRSDGIRVVVVAREKQHHGSGQDADDQRNCEQNLPDSHRVMHCDTTESLWLTRSRRTAAQYLHHACALNVAAAEDDTDIPIGHALTLLQQGREWRRSGTFCNLMRVVEIDPHRLRNGVFTDLDEAPGSPADGLNRVFVRFTRGNTVGKGQRRLSCNGFSGREG